MRTVEISRVGDRSIADPMAEMRGRLDAKGISAVRLDPSRILNGRVAYRAVFAAESEADRFIAEFDTSFPDGTAP
jgi:hypothetical protein